MNELQKFNKVYFWFASIAMAIGLILMPASGHEFDTLCWRIWSVCIFEKGLSQVYLCNCDYLPLYHYVLTVYGWLQGSSERIWENIGLLKIVSLFFHLVSGYFLVRLLIQAGMRWRQAFSMSLFFLLNIAILYNFVIWGQVDGILTCIIFLSFYFAIKGRALLTMCLFVLAVNFKLQAIIFLPLIGLMILPNLIHMLKDVKTAAWLVVPLIVQIVLILPFWAGGTLPELWMAVTSSMGRYPVISKGAYNFWELIVTGDLSTLEDSRAVMGLSLNKWGLSAFFIFGFAALLPIAMNTWRRILDENVALPELEDLALSAALIGLTFFFFNTQMHERYSHPALMFLVLFGILRKSPWLALIGCTAYLLNMDGILKGFRLGNYHTLIFMPPFVAALYLITIAGLFAAQLRKWPYFNTRIKNSRGR